MAVRKSQFVLATLGCLSAGTLDIVGLSTCHWSRVTNSTLGLWTCCDGHDNEENNEHDVQNDARNNDVTICNKLLWDSLPMHLLIVRVLAILTMVVFLISVLGLALGCLCQQRHHPHPDTPSNRFILARIPEIGTMIGSLLTLLLVAIYVTNYKELAGPDLDVSLGYSFILCVMALSIGIVAAINLCCARGYRDHQRAQRKYLQPSPFSDY